MIGYLFILDEKLKEIFLSRFTFDPELYQKVRWSYNALWFYL